MTAQQAAHGQPTALEHPVARNGFQSIFTAGWVKTAGGGQEGRDGNLVSTQEPDCDPLHDLLATPPGEVSRCNSPISSSSRSANSASRTARRGLITISQPLPSSSTWRRKISRVRRRMRLRTVARPTLRETVIPKRERAGGCPGREEPASGPEAKAPPSGIPRTGVA